MAKSIEVTLKLNDRDFIRGIKRSNRELDKLQRNMRQSGSTAKGAAGQQGFGGLTAAIAAFGAATVASSGGLSNSIKLNQRIINEVTRHSDALTNLQNVTKGGILTDANGNKMKNRLNDTSRNLRRTTKELNEEFSQLSNSQKQTNGGFVKSGARLLKFIGIATIVAAAIGAITLAFRSLTASVRTASQFEDIQITLQNITGSAEAGAYALGLVTEEATKLPFAFQDLAGATPVLATISKDLGELRRNINLAADISANFGIPFDQAASSLQRAFSAGAGAADVFREKGVLAAAGFEAGVAVSIEETQKKLLEFGVSIQGAAQTLNTTFSGATSQAGDRLTLFNAAIGEATSPTFKAFLLELVELFDNNKDAAFELAGQIGNNVVSGFQAAVIGGAYLIDVLEAAKTGFIEIVTLGGLLDGAYATIGKALESLGVSIGNGLDGIIDFDKAEMAKKFFEEVKFTAEEIKAATDGVKEGAKDIDDSFKIVLGSSTEVTENLDDTRTAFQKLKDEMDMFDGSTGDYQVFVDRLKELFETGEIGIEDFRNTMRDLDEMFMKNEGLNNFLETLGTAQKALSEDLATAFLEGKNAGDAFKDFFKKMINQIIADIIRLQIIQPILGAIMAPFGFGFGTGGNVVKIPGRAKGGPVMSNKPYVVGERGPEVFVPGQSGTIIPNGAGGGTAITYNINAVDSQSFQQALAKDPSFVFAVTEAGRRKQPGRI